MIVYGARCAWWDDISKTARTPPMRGHSIPCCPHCGGVLYQVEEPQWWNGVDKLTEQSPHYRKFVEWQRGKCFARLTDALRTYALETGIQVEIPQR